MARPSPSSWPGFLGHVCSTGQSCVWHYHFVVDSLFQNIAEIDEIPCSYKVQKVLLPAAERAIYLELEHHLRALDMTIKRAKKTESDREKRLNNALGDSKCVYVLSFNCYSPSLELPRKHS